MAFEAKRTWPLQAVILAGGRGERLGGDKPLAKLAGRPLVAHAVDRLRPQLAAGKLALNVNGRPEAYAFLGLPVIPDSVTDQPGPLAGLLAAMQAADSGSKWILSVPADTPFLPLDLAARLLAAAALGDAEIVLAAADAGICQVCGLWSIELAAGLARSLASGQNKVMAFVQQRRWSRVDFPPVTIGGKAIDPFFNVNTPADLARAEELLTVTPKVLGIAGWKNSGKTTLTERLIAELTRRGLRVAAVKHAHHSFDVDPPGTDSARHRAAGAQEIAVISSIRFAHIRELQGAPEPDLAAVIAGFAPCDLVLVEGYKRVAIPKIEVRRQASRNREPLAPDDTDVIAIAADHALADTRLPVFGLDDVLAIADFVSGWMKA